MKIKILVFGGHGLVGSRFVELYGHHLKIKPPTTEEVNILIKDQITGAVKNFNPDLIINFAAFTDVQGAQKQKDDKEGTCYKINVVGAKQVAEVCKENGIHLILISTDYVFDGQKKFAPYNENDQPNPKNWYGQTKFWGEQEVLKSGCSSTIVRISMPLSARYTLKKDIARFFLEELQNDRRINAVVDQKVTPVLVDDVANALYALIQKEAKGIYHVVSRTSTTPFDFAKLIAEDFNLDLSLIIPISLEDYNSDKSAKLLKYSWLDITKFIREFGKNILHTVEENVLLFKKQVDQLD